MKRISLRFHCLRFVSILRTLTILKMGFILCLACGKKADPRPIESLMIPQPTWVELYLKEDGIHIANNSTDFSILAERAESEVGDLFFPVYYTLATVKPQSAFIDNSTRRNTRYIYRIRTIHTKYDVYSDPITKVVSYKGAVAVESLKWRIDKRSLCVDVKLSRDVASHKIMMNGKEMDATKECYPLPNASTILLVVIPYSDGGLPGGAYSEVINVEPGIIILPPQNVRIIRMDRQITLSWQDVPGAVRYEIKAIDGRGIVVTDRTTLTIYNSNLIFENRCTEFTLISVGEKISSEPIKVQSCP